MTPAGFHLNPDKRLAIAKSFLLWDGFYRPPPPPQATEENDNIPSSPPRTPPPPEPSRKHMDLIKREWQKRVGHSWAASARKDKEGDVEAEVMADTTETVANTQEEAVTAQSEPKLEPEPEPEIVSSVEVDHNPESEPLPQPRMSKRREHILKLARMNARKPLPDSAEGLSFEQEENKRAEAEQEVEQTKKTVRERLWKFIGGNGWL